MTVIVRFDSTDLRADLLEDAIAWVRSLGVRPEDVRAQGCITMDDSSYTLHLSRFIRNEDGRMIVDLAKNDVVSEPLKVDLGKERSWPEWLGASSSVRPEATPLAQLRSTAYHVADMLRERR